MEHQCQHAMRCNSTVRPRIHLGNRPACTGAHPQTLNGRVCRRPRVAATTGTTNETRQQAQQQQEQEMQIEGLRSDYCDDFVCTSSPAVEQTVRSLARDLVRQKWTPSLFTRDVVYQGGLRRCSGADKHLRVTFIANSVKDAKVLVTRLRMLDKGAAVIDWRLRGQLGVFPVDIDFRSTFELDLITGRARLHRDEWDLSKCSPPAKLAWAASWAAWAAREGARDAQQGGKKAMERLSSGEDGSSNEGISVDPTDPTRFFQQEDNSTKDFFTLATIAALLWLFASAFYELEKIK